jgi:hypothetical protein
MRIRLGVLCLLLTATTASAQSLEQQAICAKQAKVAFEKYNADSKEFAKEAAPNFTEYQSHYNTKINKCLIDIDGMFIGNGTTTTFALLMDAYEQRIYAQYFGGGSPGNDSCDLTPSFKEQTHCSSKDEYDAFVAKYMEE